MKYERWLYNRCREIIHDLSLTDYKVEVYKEQDFTKPDMSYGLISVVVKHLTANKMYAATVEPLQIMIMAEENSLDAAQLIFTKLFQTYNWYETKEGTTTYKMQFSSPVVLNNFNVVGAGQRSVLYISATNYILENIADLEEITVGTQTGLLFINNTKVDVINFNMAYGMSGDSQPLPSLGVSDLRLFASTVRAVQNLQIALTTPCVSNNFVHDIRDMFKGAKSGNTTFTLAFKFDGETFSLPMKITSASFSTAPNETPALIVGFTL